MALHREAVSITPEKEESIRDRREGMKHAQRGWCVNETDCGVEREEENGAIGPATWFVAYRLKSKAHSLSSNQILLFQNSK